MLPLFISARVHHKSGNHQTLHLIIPHCNQRVRNNIHNLLQSKSNWVQVMVISLVQFSHPNWRVPSWNTITLQKWVAPINQKSIPPIDTHATIELVLIRIHEWIPRRAHSLHYNTVSPLVVDNNTLRMGISQAHILIRGDVSCCVCGRSVPCDSLGQYYYFLMHISWKALLPVALCLPDDVVQRNKIITRTASQVKPKDCFCKQ